MRKTMSNTENISARKRYKVSLYLKNEECFIRETLHPYLKGSTREKKIFK